MKNKTQRPVVSLATAGVCFFIGVNGYYDSPILSIFSLFAAGLNFSVWSGPALMDLLLWFVDKAEGGDK